MQIEAVPVAEWLIIVASSYGDDAAAAASERFQWREEEDFAYYKTILWMRKQLLDHYDK